MTQLSMLLQLGLYAIDADCVIGLDNRHSVLPGHTPRPEFSDAERSAIWAGLEQLAAEGRIKLIPAVAQEIKRKNPEGLKRLRKYKATRTRVSNQVRLSYQRLVARYPDWGVRGDEEYEQGDPWLVAYAMDRGYHIVSNEKPRTAQRGRRRSRTKIPDVCAIQSIPCMTLRELARQQGWIP